MKPVNQTIISKGAGNCMSAAIASLLELRLEDVPYFRGMEDDKWFSAFIDFLNEQGYEFEGTGKPNKPLLHECPNVDGFIIANVPSKTFEGATHSVIIDMDFRVVHDPNPNKLWEGAIIGREVRDWWMISKKVNP